MLNYPVVATSSANRKTVSAQCAVHSVRQHWLYLIFNFTFQMKKYDVWNRTIKPKLTTFTCSSKRHRCSYTPQNCWTEQTEQHLCPSYDLTTSGVKKHKGSAGVKGWVIPLVALVHSGNLMKTVASSNVGLRSVGVSILEGLNLWEDRRETCLLWNIGNDRSNTNNCTFLNPR